MVTMEIVSFCRIIPLCNFQYRNHGHSITLLSFHMQRLRKVPLLDVSAVAGHYAMPAALLYVKARIA